MVWYNIILLLVGVSYIEADNCGFNYDVIAMKNLDLHKIKGDWYEISRTENVIEESMHCGQLTIHINESLSLLLNFTHMDLDTNIKDTISTEYQPALHNNTAHFIISSKVFPKASTELHAAVLHTDYDNYAVLAACYDFNLIANHVIWIYARKNTLSSQHLTEIDDILTNRSISDPQLIHVTQDNHKCGRGGTSQLRVSLILFCAILFFNKLF